MLDWPIVLYLFLGGSASGALVVLCIIELVCAEFPRQIKGNGLAICFLALVVGVLLLLFALGRPERVLSFFTAPTFSAITVGFYGLIAALVCAAALCLFNVMYISRLPRACVVLVAAVGIVAGCVVMVYTGVFLQGMPSVSLWNTPLLPAIFVLSSLSSGMAMVFTGSVFANLRDFPSRTMRLLSFADSVVIVLEAAVLVAYVCFGLFAAGDGLGMWALLNGRLALPFWGGVVACGLVAPLVIERRMDWTTSKRAKMLLVLSVLLLTGALALRYCVSEMGVYDISQMAFEALWQMME